MALIENVRGIDPIDSRGAPSAARLAISFFVSLGYQAKLTTIRASDYGGATSRHRLFIIVTVPSIPLPGILLPTHGDALNLDPLVTTSSAVRDLG